MKNKMIALAFVMGMSVPAFVSANDEGEASTSESASVVSTYVTGPISSAGTYVKDTVTGTATAVKDGVTGAVNYGVDTTKNVADWTWGYAWRDATTTGKAIRVAGVAAAAVYVINDKYGDDIRELLGCDETDADCEACN